MDRELNLPLTAPEAAVVEMALKRMRGDITAYITLAEQQRVTIEDLQYKHYIGMIDKILNKVERMADEG